MKFPFRSGRNKRERELQEEVDAHFAIEIQRRIEAGATQEEAELAARRDFGNVTRVKEVTRSMWGLSIFERLGQDIRYAARRLRNAPAFTVTSILTLALCLGANLSIFAVIDAILVRPLPFPHANRLVSIFNTYPKAGVERDGSSLTNYYERRGAIPALSSLSIYGFRDAIIGQPGSTVREPVTYVSGDFFATVGRGPVIGRTFTDREMTYQQTDGVVIVTNDYWRQHFHADPRAIGQTVWVNSLPTTVIGVLPAGFRFLSSKAEFYMPVTSRPEDRTPLQRHSGGNVIQMIARLKPAATLVQAQAQIDAQNAALEKDDPKRKMIADAGFRSIVMSLHADQVAAVRPMLITLQAGVLTLLLIGGVNLVNLLLIRSSGRLKELAVRQALGASRRDLSGEVLIETTLLTLCGGLLALGLGAGGIRLLTVLGADRLPLGEYITFDARLALAAFVTAIVLGAAMAVPIAWFGLRSDPSGAQIALQAESRSTTASRAAQALRHGFIIAQIALGFVLLACAALLGISLERAMAVSPGFRAENTVAGQISLVGKRYPSASAGLNFAGNLADEVRKQPGVSAVGIATNIPFSGQNGKSAATASGRAPSPRETPRGIYSYGVSGDYFQAMGFSLRAGRFLNEADSRRTERTCVVDEDFARYNWPHTSPLGQRLFMGADRGPEAEAFTVVGVVGSIKQAGLTDDTAQGAVYYPYIYRPDNNIFVVVRGAISTAALQSELQSVVRQIDPELAVNGIQSMNDRIAASLMDRRSPALLAGIFSAIALLLVTVGTYGVLSYAVALRRREIAIRMAIGARPAEIRRHFLSLGLRLLTAGAVLGLLGTWMAGRAMEAVLFHVPAHSWAVLGGTAAAIATVFVCACLLPASRAARISPVQALAGD